MTDQALEEWTNSIHEHEQKKQREREIMVTKTTIFGGAFLVMVGLLGFVFPGFMGMHLSVAHNILLLLSGAVALYFGLKATPAAARTFCIVFGAAYGLLGLAGFVAGGQDYTFTIIPGALVLGTMDHFVHLILGAIFLSVGWGLRAVTATPPTR
jgi:type II secretory pathway component PulF